MIRIPGSVRGRAALLVMAMSVFWTYPALSRPLVLSLDAISLDDEDPERTRIGRLVWRGGFAITAPDVKFGGLSGLSVSPDGKILSMVSDAGSWIRMHAGYDTDGNLQTLDKASIGQLRAPLGAVVAHKNGGDAESLESVPGGLAVSFEHNHRLWIYRGPPGPFANPFAARPQEILYPPILGRAHPNQGVETLVRLGDGRLLKGFRLGPAICLAGYGRMIARPRRGGNSAIAAICCSDRPARRCCLMAICCWSSAVLPGPAGLPPASLPCRHLQFVPAQC
jgi:hypothetical protein